MKNKNRFIGKWRIISMGNWDQDYVNIEEPGYIGFDKKDSGKLHFGLITAEIDYRIVDDSNEDKIEFTFAGVDEFDNICGRGTVYYQTNLSQLIGKLFIHFGDESTFAAKRFT